MNKGLLAEEKAIQYLIANNYEILERNFRIYKCEIDILCKKNNEIFVCEVKYRSYLENLKFKKSQLKNFEIFFEYLESIYPNFLKHLFVIFVTKNKIQIFQPQLEDLI